MLQLRENQTELVTELENFAAKITEMAPAQVPTEESLIARILGAISHDPVIRARNSPAGWGGALNQGSNPDADR